MSIYRESNLQNDSKLVLLLEHQDEKNNVNKIDSRIFILYDPCIAKFCLFGRRCSKEPFNRKYPPYSFQFDSKTDVFEFAKRTIGRNEQCRVTLYNFNNLVTVFSSEYSFEFFEDLMDKHYEIAGYDNCELSSSGNSNIIRTFLRSMKKTATF